MLKNFLFLTISIAVFFAVTFLYGSILQGKEKPLSEILAQKQIDEIENPSLSIKIRENSLLLYDGKTFLKRYRVSLGHADYKLAKFYKRYVTTPTGTFAVCKIKRNSRFLREYKLNYPDSTAVKTAYEKNLIDKKTMFSLLEKEKYGCNTDADKTVFGPELTIHGYGKLNFVFKNLPFVFNWTNGSVALSNEDLEELSPFLKIGMKIKIEN